MSKSESYAKAEFFRMPNLSEYLPNVPKCGLNTRHDNRLEGMAKRFSGKMVQGTPLAQFSTRVKSCYLLGMSKIYE